MRIHLLDGTYELFRHHFALPSHRTSTGREVAAVRGVLSSVLSMFEQGVTHLGVATDHVIESFRNDMWPGYKTSEGMEPALLEQFPLLEEALDAMGVTVFAMVEHEADDALASAAAVATADDRVEQVLICTPDKDLAQCVVGRRIVQFDRRRREMRDERGVVQKFGVPPASIPDYLALVGDSADGYPGLPGWGARSAATVLARFGSLDDIPASARDWKLPLRNADRLASVLREGAELVRLFRDLAVLRRDSPVPGTIDDLAWRGPQPGFAALAGSLDDPDLAARATKLWEGYPAKA